MMKLGVFSVCMPEYGLEESVDILKGIGYDAVEWRVAEIPDEKPDDIPYDRRYWIWNRSTVDIKRIGEIAGPLKKLCDDAGLHITGFTTYLTPEKQDELIPVLDAARAIGVKQIRLFTDNYTYDENQRPYTEIFKETKENIKKLEALAREYGVKIVFEIHHDNIFASASSAIRLIEGCDPECIGIIVDPGNMVNEGYENYRKVFEILGPYVAHIHIKNGRLEEDGRDEFGALRWKRVWVPLKEGQADLARFFKELKRTGYDGTISLEDFSNEMDTKEKLQYSLDYIKELWQKA